MIWFIENADNMNGTQEHLSDLIKTFNVIGQRITIAITLKGLLH